MKIFVGQIYIKAGVMFPFSLRFQKWLGDALSERVQASERYCHEVGASFALGIRISAKEDIVEPEIKGPSLFKREKTIEFSIFLPHCQRDYHDIFVSSLVVGKILKSVVAILQQLGLDATKVVRDLDLLEAEFMTTPGLLV
jgi:hypothetical protein